MRLTSAFFILLVVSLCGAVTGCQKPRSISQTQPPTVLSSDTIASIHWQGKRWLGYEATAFFFMRVWNLPVTTQLERQTLEKLAVFPVRYLPATSSSQDQINSLKSNILPLLSDLENEESYLEIRAISNSAPDCVLAVRLDTENPDVQAGRWFTNLAAVLEPITGGHVISLPQKQGWILNFTNASNSKSIQLARVDNWTLIGFAERTNLLFDDISGRIQKDGKPFVSGGMNLWFEATLDPNWFTGTFPNINSFWRSPMNVIHHVHLTLTGDGANVITRANVTLEHSWTNKLSPWQLPESLVHEPLTSFTAARGLQPWLDNWSGWRHWLTGPPPDQIYIWSLAESPFNLYVAAPLPDATHRVSELANHLIQKGNPWLADRGYISFDRAADGNGLSWGNLSAIRPFVRSATTGSNQWIYAGLLPDNFTGTNSLPADIIHNILIQTNMVYYNWENSGSRLQPCLELTQTARQILRRPQLPADSVSLQWLATMIPRLGVSITTLKHNKPNEISLYRRSTLGFTALELHMIADWLESPQFPNGLYTFATSIQKTH